MPVTRTHFLNYQSFRKRIIFTTYPKELPISAHDLKNYFYEGFLADKSGYHVTYVQKDYELMKKKRLESYNLNFPWDVYCYDGGKKLNPEHAKINYDKIDLYEDDQIYSYEGILCNDETYE